MGSNNNCGCLIMALDNLEIELHVYNNCTKTHSLGQMIQNLCIGLKKLHVLILGNPFVSENK